MVSICGVLTAGVIRRQDQAISRGLHVLVLVAVLLMFAASFEMLRRVIGSTSPWLAMLLMFYFLGLARVAEPLVRFRMPGVLRPLRPWELTGNVYRRFRVPAFGRLLRRTPLRFLNSAVYIVGARSDPRQVRLFAESSEASHLWAGLLLLPYIAFAGLKGRWQVVAWFSLAEVLVNVYPLLHLRYARGRLDRALRRGRFIHADVASFKGDA